MSYTVLARKYRPQSFDELVGQEHVAKTLANAIAQERVAHAFLFTGVRGVGKTTTARLLAKSLNCEKGPTASPCNACGPCVDITAGRDVDVQEIDGASNNGVDDVRRLQESLPYRPARDRYKIVIVDEVHMLSTGAFNAFLKTLEEPPPHVKFIFATTESHKVPVTIRSRCQRYDFRLIPQNVVSARVRDILGREGLEADDAAVALVAREAAGSMRDALTLLDQIVAFSGGKLVGADIARQLGVAGREHVHAIVSAMLTGDARAVLVVANDVTTQGVDPLHFVKQLLELLRDIVVYAVGGDEGALVDFVEEERRWADSMISDVERVELERAFAMTSRVVDEVARSAAPMLVLEMGLLRIASRPRMRSVEELLGRLEALEAKLGKGGPDGTGPRGSGPSGGPRGGGGGSRPSGPTPLRSEGAQPSPSGHAPRASASPSTSASSTSPGTVSAPTETPLVATARAPSSSSDATSPADAALAAAISLSARLAAQVSPRARVEEAGRPSKFEGPRTPAMPTQAAPAAEVAHTAPIAPMTPTNAPAAAPASTRPAAAPGLSDDRIRVPESTRPEAGAMRRSALLEWEAIVSRVRGIAPHHAAVLEHGVPRTISRERIVVAFQEKSFFGRQAEQPAVRDAVLAAAEETLGVRPSLDIRFDAEASMTTRTVAAVEAQRRSAENESKKREALSHPRVLDALDVFPDARGQEEVRFEGES